MLATETINIVKAFFELRYLIMPANGVNVSDKIIMNLAILAVDEFLIAIFFLIFSVGLYNLFINSKSSILEDDNNKILHASNFDELKNKMGKIIILVLIIDYFKFAVEMCYKTSLELLYFALGIMLIAIALFFIKNNIGLTKRKVAKNQNKLQP